MSVINFAMILLTIAGGTFHGTGRIGGIAVDPSDPSGNTYRVAAGNDKNKSATDAQRDSSGNTVYIATAGGGVWK
jgi:hypothetical protein